MVNASIQNRLIAAASTAAQLRQRALAEPTLALQVAIVKAWQAYRLSQTHADLLQSARYRAAALFFVNDLYGSKSLTQRDAELARVIPTMNRFLPQAALSTICDAIELDALSESLDHRVAEKLVLKGRAAAAQAAVGEDDAVGALEPYDRDAYAAAYRAGGGFEQRRQQIVAVQRIGQDLDGLVRKPLLGGLLASMGPPARAAGLAATHEFLQRGFSAFKAMGGAREFLRLVVSREQALAEALEQGDPSKLPN